MGTNEVTETYKVQPGFCVGMEDFISDVGLICHFGHITFLVVTLVC